MKNQSKTLKTAFQSTVILAVIFAAADAMRAATFTVTNTNDSGAGSLRQALADADAAAGADTIKFSLSHCPCTVALTSGRLSINSDVTIEGAGVKKLSISGNSIDGVFSTAAGTTSTIDGVEISGGASFFGGAIYSTGNLTLSNVRLVNNRAENGGAVYNYPGAVLTVINSTISSNSASGQDVWGGGITNYGGALIVSSTISSNSGGGIYSAGVGAGLTIINSTISGNSAFADGGGIYNIGAELNIFDSTIALNRCNTLPGSVGPCGAGLSDTDFSSASIINNSIIAGNQNLGTIAFADVLGSPIPSASFIANNNLVGDPATSGPIIRGVNGNLVGFDVGLVLNTTLANNGGPTMTHALVKNSPAINAGNNSLAVDLNNTPLLYDQRGTGFPRIQGGTVDIGAFEITKTRR